MRGVNLSQFGVVVITALIFGIIGCGDSAKSDLAKFDGNWQSLSNNQNILLKFSGDNKTITIDGKTLSATVNQYEVDRYKIHVSDKAAGEKDWTIFRIWDDNGSNFTLRFEHDGKTEDLERVKG